MCTAVTGVKASGGAVPQALFSKGWAPKPAASVYALLKLVFTNLWIPWYTVYFVLNLMLQSSLLLPQCSLPS